MDTHAYAHLCAGMLTAPFARSVSFQADKQMGCFHTDTHTVLQTHTYLHVHVHVPKPLPNIMYNAEKHE